MIRINKDSGGVTKQHAAPQETFCDRVALNLGNSDTLELLIAVMMAKEGYVTLNRWEREREREERMCEKVLWLFHISLEKWPAE